MKTLKFALVAIVAIVGLAGFTACDNGNDDKTGEQAKSQTNTELFGATVTGYMTDTDWATACANLKAGYDVAVEEGDNTATRCRLMYTNSDTIINLANNPSYHYYKVEMYETYGIINYNASFVLGATTEQNRFILAEKIRKSANAAFGDEPLEG